MIYPQNCPNQTCGYWLITSNQQTLCTETDIFNIGQLQNSVILQNNSVNGALVITMNCVINYKTLLQIMEL